ncbi:hypothetical protein OEZ86_004501 [Tetradesmus obliquus]|nr:hypothetical protein OEZ86_004501 [Tetradesmus obliquus]
MAETSEVIGHYVQQQGEGGYQWVPALDQSTELFKAVIGDDISRVEQLYTGLGGSSTHVCLFWGESKEQTGAPRVEAKSRTLAAIATQHGALRVLSYLLSKGVNPGSEGLYEFIESSNPNAPTIRAMLDDAAGNFAPAPGEAPAGPGAHGARTATPDAHGSGAAGQQGYAQQELDQADLENLPYSTADLTRPEYATDTFRMYCFKVLRCSKRYAHDWRACPFAHPTENARRRDPRETRYSSLVCPDYRQGCCVRGDTCQYAHGVFESWLHPSRYRTQLCKDQEKCDRPVCFFAHTISELRTPVDSFVPNPEERLRVPQATQVVLGIAPPPALQMSAGGADTAYAADQGPPVVPDLLSPGQRAASSSSGGGLAAAASAGSGGGAPDSFGSSSQLDQAAAAAAAAVGLSGGGGGGSPSPVKQLVSPNAVPVPRMSNAFARKHGLDPKDNPLLNLQRIALQQTSSQPQQQACGGGGGGGSSRRQRRGRNHHQQQQQQASSQQPLLQQQLLQPGPPQLLQPPLSPAAAAAAAAAYYGAAAQAPMGPAGLQHAHMQPNPNMPPPLIDPQAVALLFGGMNLGGPPLSPAAAAAAAMGGMPGGMHHPQLQMNPYAMGPGAMAAMHHHQAGMLGPAGLGPPSPLGQPGMHPSAGLHSPQPPF